MTAVIFAPVEIGFSEKRSLTEGRKQWTISVLAVARKREVVANERIGIKKGEGGSTITE